MMIIAYNLTIDEFCSCNECTEDEMKAAIQGMLFIDASNLLLTNPTESEVCICYKCV